MALTWLIAIPAAGGILAWLAGRWSAAAARWIALMACAADLVLAVVLWATLPDLPAGGLALEQRAAWVPQLGISYIVGLDGLNVLLVTLTAALAVAAVAASWREIDDQVGPFHLALGLLTSAIMGVFLSFDLLVFYLFWEAMLIPMYFLIVQWGHENRRYAAVKFFLFTFISGFFMLAGILGLYIFHGRATGVYTFDSTALADALPGGPYAFLLMLGFFTALAVKLPVVPLHTWLPDAHTEAPTAGSVILAGLMLKTGAYGMLRFAVPLFPEASVRLAPVAMTLGVVGIIYGAVLAFSQTDLKRMIAYTSVSHMGFVLLGIYAGNELALQGAVMAIIAHGFATGGLFLIAGMLQERTHTRDIHRLGGLWATTPKMGGFTLFFAIAALGLPGLANFIGEALVLFGAFRVSPVLAILGAVGLVLAVVYSLKLVQVSMFGPNKEQWSLADLSAREVAILGSLAALLLWLGLHPQPVISTARDALAPVSSALAGQDIAAGGGAR